MKIRVTGTVICFNFSDEKYHDVEYLCGKLGLRIKRPEKGEYEKPVGEFAGLLGITPEDGQIDFDDELMLLYNFPGSELDKFLKTLRVNELEIPYKAMLTETNKSWTAAELAKQIKLEHEQMKAAGAK